MSRALGRIWILSSLLLGGCAPLLSELIVTAPNRFNPFVGNPDLTPPPLETIAADQHFYVPVGPPNALLSVSVLEPKAVSDTEKHPPKGTILVVHGIRNRGLWMLGTARRLSEAGYRTVLVDLRGHGHSTGEWLTYGPREAEDLSQVIDELDRRKLLEGRLGVYGISYGATTAIHLAAIDPRVEAVVAVAPFGSMREEVPHYLRTALPGVGSLIPDSTIQEAIDVAGRKGGFNPDQSNARAAIQHTKARVLILHGTGDWLVPPENAGRLQESSGGRASTVLLPGEGHISIWFDTHGEVAEYTRLWFNRWLWIRREPSE